MSDKPKTAVQWLMEQISYENGYGERYNTFTNQKDLTEFFKQALAMERENSCKFATRYEDYCWRLSQNNRYDTPMTAEQYYNETYKKD
jgi:hypothetical protein